MSRLKHSLKPQDNPLDRAAQRHHFLGHQPMTALPCDASKRQYFRYDGGLLMDAPPPENPTQFVAVATYLKDLGFSAPAILAEDLSQGFLAIEDFGESTYTKLLQAGHDPYPLYELAVDTLIALHMRATDRPEFIPSYDVDHMLREVTLFTEWYVPANCNKVLSNSEKQEYLDLWKPVFEKAVKSSQTLALRDFHVDNLMLLKDRADVAACGLLDFQDAGWGPIVYDLISLVEDERLDLEPALIEHCWQRYLAAFPHLNEEALRSSGCLLAAGRHAKNIGIFTRLAVRDGKTHYLNHLPRMWKMLHSCLEHPDLASLKAWFKEHNQEPKSYAAFKSQFIKGIES